MDNPKIGRLILSRILNFLLIFFVFGCILGVLRIFLFLTNIDLIFSPISLEVKVLSELNGRALSDVNVKIGEVEVKTDKNGVAQFNGIQTTDILISVQAQKYNSVDTSISLGRIFNENNYKVEIKLIPNEIGSISGRLLANESYEFLDDKLLLDEVVYEIKKDGTFSIGEIAVAKEISFKFISDNFVDIDRQLSISSGVNILPDIKLQPAGDFVGELKTYVREDLIKNVRFDVFGVSENQIEISANGQFKIRDLEVGRTYQLRVFAPGYLTQDYSQQIKQGKNDLFGFKLIEEGKVIHFSNKDNTQNFYKSNLDGSDYLAITNNPPNKRLSPNEQFFDNNKSIFYFGSEDLENIRSLQTKVNIPYMIDINSTGDTLPTRLINNIENLGTLYHFFEAQTTLNIYQERGSNRDKTYVFEAIDLKSLGNKRKVLRRGINLFFDNLKVSDNSKYSFYGEYTSQPTSQTPRNLRRMDIDTGDVVILEENSAAIELLDVSYDGNIAIYSMLNTNTKLRELVKFNVATMQKAIISKNFTGRLVSLWNQDENKLIYVDKKDGREGIFMMDLIKNTNQRVLSLTPNESYIDFFHQSKYSFYRIKSGLFVVDLANPKNYKKVL
jgi:hypothetical protein